MSASLSAQLDDYAVTQDIAREFKRDGEAMRRLEDENDRLREVLASIIHWAESRCPCKDETPEPCPLCGASVDGVGLDGVCKAVEAIFPREMLTRTRAALDARSAV